MLMTVLRLGIHSSTPRHSKQLALVMQKRTRHEKVTTQAREVM